jgi:outer membrane protein assembly factor BamB
MICSRLVPFLSVVGFCGVLSGCSQAGETTGTGPSYVVDQPRAGQALITGTRQTIRWHGGEPGDTVDVKFVPWSGAAVVLAEGVKNSGTATAEIHLISDEVRQGGKIVVEASSPSTGSSAAALTGDDGDGLKVGSLAAFSWSGTVEEYDWIDVLSGAQENVGTVGDLATWTMKTLAVDHQQDRLYVLGFDAAQQQKLYVLDSKTGALDHDVAVACGSTFSGLGVTADHALLAFSWNAATTKEEMTRIDTGTGACTVVGTVGDLQWWSDETAYDATSDAMHVFGMPSAEGPLTLYTLDATTGALRGQSPVTAGGAPVASLGGVVVDSAGQLLGFRWNGAQEEMLRVDSATGVGSVAGTVGDLETWSNIARIDLTSDTVYVLGQTATGASALYALDATTGTLDYSIPTAESPTNAILVY